MKNLDASSGSLVVAVVLALASCGWSAWTTKALRPQPAAVLVAHTATPSNVPATRAATDARAWLPPAAQSPGAEWIYDLFTPPEIFYDATANRFSVTPPDLAKPRSATAPLAGVELVRVERELYRWQLVGFIGRDGDWCGTFEDRQTGATLMGREGRALADTGLEVRSLAVRRVAVALPDSMSTTQRVATAVLRDVRTGEEMTLNSAERRVTDVLVATITTPGGERHEVHAGDEFAAGDDALRVEAIHSEPASVELVRVARGNVTAPERHTLSLKTTPAVATATSSPFAAP